jgi:hypothetical protein
LKWYTSIYTKVIHVFWIPNDAVLFVVLDCLGYLINLRRNASTWMPENGLETKQSWCLTPTSSLYFSLLSSSLSQTSCQRVVVGDMSSEA